MFCVCSESAGGVQISSRSDRQRLPVLTLLRSAYTPGLFCCKLRLLCAI